MTEIGRNDPCHCGSGKKYKKCCLKKEQEFNGRRREEGNAVGAALAWLSDHQSEAVDEAIHGDYFGPFADEEFEALNALPPEIRGMLDSNIGEWLLTDAIFEIDGERKRARDLLFAPGGPVLPARGRQWLEAISERAMSLYEVREVTPGEGLWLQDTLRPGEKAVWVPELAASRSLVQWDMLGARLVERDGEWVFTGAVYPLSRDEATACREEILHDMEGQDWASDLAREVTSAAISACWIASLVTESPLPELVDASTREPLVLVTERYRVKDWPRLEAVLAQQADVEGSRKESWVRFVELGGEMRRSKAVLNVREPDRLEVFCRTVKLADEARAWLGDIAGAALEHRARGIVDPRSPAAREVAAGKPQTRLPPQLEAQVVNDFLRNRYENWTEETIPALGNRTPRECLGTTEGRKAVVDLLKSYEQHEARRGREQGTGPFDFGFLWERLGLTPEE